MKKYLSILCAFALLLSAVAFQVPVHAATTYVDESNFSSLSSIVSGAGAGDTIVIKKGTYSNKGNITLSNSNGITIKAEIQNEVIFTGNVAITLTGQNMVFKDFKFVDVLHQQGDTNKSTVLLKGLSNSQIYNNYFKHCGDETPTQGVFSHVLELKDTSQYNTISRNTFDDNISMSVGVIANATNYGSTYNTISYNYFKDIKEVGYYWPGGTNGMECIQVGQGANPSANMYTTISNNLFENCVGDGAELISIKSSNNPYCKCTTYYQ